MLRLTWTKIAFISIRRSGPPLNAAISKWPSSQINCPAVHSRYVVITGLTMKTAFCFSCYLHASLSLLRCVWKWNVLQYNQWNPFFKYFEMSDILFGLLLQTFHEFTNLQFSCFYVKNLVFSRKTYPPLSSLTIFPIDLVLYVARDQARTQGGGCIPCIPPPDLQRCWHDTWFHWKSSPKIFLYCTLLV